MCGSAAVSAVLMLTVATLTIAASPSVGPGPHCMLLRAYPIPGLPCEQSMLVVAGSETPRRDLSLPMIFASKHTGTEACTVRDPQHAASLTVGAAAAEAPGLRRSNSASRLAAAALLQAAARRERRNSFSEIYSWEGLQVVFWGHS